MRKQTYCEYCEDVGFIEVKKVRRDGTVLREDVSCKECCLHEFDPDEGYECLQCGKTRWE